MQVINYESCWFALAIGVNHVSVFGGCVSIWPRRRMRRREEIKSLNTSQRPWSAGGKQPEDCFRFLRRCSGEELPCSPSFDEHPKRVLWRDEPAREDRRRITGELEALELVTRMLNEHCSSTRLRCQLGFPGRDIFVSEISPKNWTENFRFKLNEQPTALLNAETPPKSRQWAGRKEEAR